MIRILVELLKSKHPEASFVGPVIQHCKFIDQKKSKSPDSLFDSRTGKFFSLSVFDRQFSDVQQDYYLVRTKEEKLPVAVFSVVKGENGVQDGIVGFWHTQHLLSSRKRADGLIGLETIDDPADTRLSERDIEVSPETHRASVETFNVPVRGIDESDFGKSGKYFSCELLSI